MRTTAAQSLATRARRGAGLLSAALAAAAAGCAAPQGQAPAPAAAAPYAAADPRLLDWVANALGTHTVPGNRVEPLVNGDAFFPAMLTAIGDARESITLESYIYWGGAIGRRFTEALAQRARQGVRVHILLDWLGSRHIDHADVRRLRREGAEVAFFSRFNPLRPGRVNYRDHRKLLVVDGRVGFIGGAGIADVWLGAGAAPDSWRDAFYRVEGPVVAQLQSLFMANWARVTRRVEAGPAYFPPLPEAGPIPAHAFGSTGGAMTDSVRRMYLLALGAARTNVRLCTAYFVPCSQTQAALIAARRRGVKVEVLVPSDRVDSKVVRPASRRRYGPLLQAGVRIYEYAPAMHHGKILIVDDAWVSLGSANLDNRSFRYSDEANLNLLDPAFAADQVRVFEADKQLCREITFDAWKRRSLPRRTTEALVEPFVPLL